jgi:hypothetical protein
MVAISPYFYSFIPIIYSTIFQNIPVAQNIIYIKISWSKNLTSKYCKNIYFLLKNKYDNIRIIFQSKEYFEYFRAK